MKSNVDVPLHEHYCTDIENYPIEKFLQKGTGKGKSLLIVGESPAPNGWRISGKACYTKEGRLLPTGKRLNELLRPYGLSVEICGFTELAKCYVGKDRKLLHECSQKCWPIFIKQAELSESKLILLLGIKTLEIYNQITGYALKVGEISDIKLENNSYLVLPIYHPSPINPYSHQKNKLIFGNLKEELSNFL